MFDFRVVSGPVISGIVERDRRAVIDIVRETYFLHERGRTINPDSYFLRFPQRPNARIIALPAYLDRQGREVAGIKWISSFPDNTEQDVPRASAVLLLNDATTGHPFACLEAAGISAARTAASAALAAQVLSVSGDDLGTVAIVGAGVIARTIVDFLVAGNVRPRDLVVHDLDPASSEALVDHARREAGISASTADLGSALKADLVIFATTASEPYVDEVFRPGQVILNISLRDLAPSTIVGATNIFDDIEHCMKANTSAHLAEQQEGNRDFATATLAQVMGGSHVLSRERPIIFSPFGLGVLDLALGVYVYDAAVKEGRALDVPHFFADTARWASPVAPSQASS